MIFDEAMQHATDALEEAEKAVPTGSVDPEGKRTRIYITIAEWWLKVAETLQEQFVLNERKKEIDRNHDLAEKLKLFPGMQLNMGEVDPADENKGAYR